MDAGNAPIIGNIQRVEGIVCHASNIFRSHKGPLSVNCSAIIVHMIDMISIDNQMKRSKKIRHTAPGKFCEDMD